MSPEDGLIGHVVLQPLRSDISMDEEGGGGGGGDVESLRNRYPVCNLKFD